MYAELSPVTDFREACCRQYEMGSVVSYVVSYVRSYVSYLVDTTVDLYFGPMRVVWSSSVTRLIATINEEFVNHFTINRVR